MFAIVAGPSRNAMPPPQLARDAPVVDVIHPVQINLFVIFRDDGDLAALDGFDCFLRERLNFYEPLLGEAWLDYSSAAIAFPEGECVVFLGDQKSLLLQIRQHALAGLVTVEAGVRPGGSDRKSTRL